MYQASGCRVNRLYGSDRDAYLVFSNWQLTQATAAWNLGLSRLVMRRIGGGPESTRFNQRAGGQTECTIFAVLEVKKEISA
jgi:hypothetical protein